MEESDCREDEYLYLIVDGVRYEGLCGIDRDSDQLLCACVHPLFVYSTHYILKFGFINGVDNVNWPPYRDSKS